MTEKACEFGHRIAHGQQHFGTVRVETRPPRFIGSVERRLLCRVCGAEGEVFAFFIVNKMYGIELRSGCRFMLCAFIGIA